MGIIRIVKVLRAVVVTLNVIKHKSRFVTAKAVEVDSVHTVMNVLVIVVVMRCITDVNTATVHVNLYSHLGCAYRIVFDTKIKPLAKRQCENGFGIHVLYRINHLVNLDSAAFRYVELQVITRTAVVAVLNYYGPHQRQW